MAEEQSPPVILPAQTKLSVPVFARRPTEDDDLALPLSFSSRLRDLGIMPGDVKRTRLHALHSVGSMRVDLWRNAASAVRDVLIGAQEATTPEGDNVLPFVGAIVDNVLADGNVMLGLTGLRAHDTYTHAHSVNVCILSSLIGRGLGLTRAELVSMGTGAILHDLGKVFIDNHLLAKGGPLTAEEFSLIRQHTESGYAALLEGAFMEPAAAATVLQHHERLDGTGYPNGLRDADLGLFSRIVAVADVFDALSNDRPYRPAYSPEKCLHILLEDEHNKLWIDAVAALVLTLTSGPENRFLTPRGGDPVSRLAFNGSDWVATLAV